MRKSGLADSPLFSMPAKPKMAAAPLSDKPPAKKAPRKEKERSRKPKAAKPSSNHDVTTPSNHAIMTSRRHDAIIEIIRRTVRVIGKEPSTHRLTPEEKKLIADIVYAYRSSGMKTSENEVARIAINFAINDYKENGETSILHKVLRALNE